MSGTARASLYTDVRLVEDPKGLRFSSGRVVCIEGLHDGKWVGRYWSADGRTSTPYEVWAEDAFVLEIDQEPVTGWTLEKVEEATGKRHGLRHSVVELSCKTRPLNINIHTLLDGTPVLTRWLEIGNSSGESIAITGIFPWVVRLWAHSAYREHPPGGLDHAFTLGRFTRSDWAYEGWLEWQKLETEMTSIKCDKGQGFDDPFFVLRNEATGEHWIGHLAWSANWLMEFELERGVKEIYDSLVFRLGPWASVPQRVVSPGESVQSPKVHIGYVSGDLDSTVQAMHDHIRGSVLPPGSPGRSHLVQFSVPGDQGYPKGSSRGLDERTLLANVDLAAELGAELFIVDADWWDVVGNWTPSKSRFPDGLEPVAEYSRGKGLLFGLYAELEGGRGNWEKSAVHMEHPDWFGPKNVLNLARPEVAEYVESELVQLIERYNLDLFRLDYNPLFTYEGPTTRREGYDENNYWRYYEAFYSMFERIQKRYPNLILQQAAAGGARNDLGTAGRFHEMYLTDGLRVPHVLQVYSGQTLALPPEAFVIGLGADAGAAKGRAMNLDTNLRTIFTLSTPWIFGGMAAPNLEALGTPSLERFRHYAGIYKEFIRPILPGCRMFHHAPVSSSGGVTGSGWFAAEFSSPARKRGWATIVRMGPSSSDDYIFRPRGLHRGMTYRVTFDSTAEAAVIDGLRLAGDGLRVCLENIGSSELLLFESTDEDGGSR